MLHDDTIQLQTRQWHPTLVLLPGKSHGRRSLVGCSPWGREESDKTERLHFHFSLSCIEEGNGNPLQCSCLENPRNGGAWWASIYGVAESQTRLKQQQQQQLMSCNSFYINFISSSLPTNDPISSASIMLDVLSGTLLKQATTCFGDSERKFICKDSIEKNRVRHEHFPSELLHSMP